MLSRKQLINVFVLSLMTAFTGAVAAGDKAGDDGAPAVGEVRAGDGVSHKDAGKGKSPCAH